MAEQQGQDSVLFRARGNLITTNANLYIANNNNPFLVSPYAPPTAATTKAAINSLSSLISTQIGNLSSVINLNTYTLSISTIRPLPSDAQQTLTIQASTINIDGAFPGAAMNVYMSSFYNTINTNYLTVNSTLSVSTITGNANFGNLYGNDVVASTLTVSSVLQVSTISSGNMTFNTQTGTSSIVSTLTVSSVANIQLLNLTSTISTNANAYTQSIPITVNGITYLLPLITP